jgi:hypothetical protein
MSWVAILLIVVGLWLALKVVGVVLKVVLWGAAIVAVYWLLAPHFGLPWPF